MTRDEPPPHRIVFIEVPMSDALREQVFGECRRVSPRRRKATGAIPDDPKPPVAVPQAPHSPPA